MTSECTGCGACCLNARCSLADEFTTAPFHDEQTCPFLVRDVRASRYWCSLVLQDETGYVREELLIGRGCVCDSPRLNELCGETAG